MKRTSRIVRFISNCALKNLSRLLITSDIVMNWLQINKSNGRMILLHALQLGRAPVGLSGNPQKRRHLQRPCRISHMRAEPSP